jgi:hypothetical protein
MAEWRWADDPEPDRPDPLRRALQADLRPRLEHDSVLFSVDTIDVPVPSDSDPLCVRSFSLRAVAAERPEAHATFTRHRRRVWRSRVFATDGNGGATVPPVYRGVVADAENVFRSLLEQADTDLHSDD